MKAPAVLMALGALAAVNLAACSRQHPQTAALSRMGPEAAKERARADSLRYPYTKADIDFMSGMIHHHAQAIQISKWAPSHGGSPSIIRLTERIINAQRDEINLMQGWLRDRNQLPPAADTLGTGMSHAGMQHAGMQHGASPMMPGMLTDEQLKQLDAARGTEFDRLFLTFMIQHHRGAVTMVKELFAARGAGQDETVFKFAADVEVDQSTEIRRMLQMLLELP
ncbi:MAG: DUF305 domain-containing protein [Gemmatimonadaceae bacterium]|nr:DUF305 domain-containing protein [Gemmatimonadaceae bacterium]